MIVVDELFSRLERALGEGRGVLAFDADGTLWSGDVGEDVFLHACAHGLLKPDATEALRELAREHHLAEVNDANAQARVLFDAYRAGALPERRTCEMMAWAFAGWRETQLAELVSEVLHTVQIATRWFEPVHRVLGWAREHELPTVVVSASPDFVIRVATNPLGFGPNEIAATRPAVEAGALAPRLAAPVPYAEDKPRALRALHPEATLLAAFGDNVFDLALLQEARVPVAVRPKPALAERLERLPGVFTLI